MIYKLFGKGKNEKQLERWIKDNEDKIWNCQTWHRMIACLKNKTNFDWQAWCSECRFNDPENRRPKRWRKVNIMKRKNSWRAQFNNSRVQPQNRLKGRKSNKQKLQKYFYEKNTQWSEKKVAKGLWFCRCALVGGFLSPERIIHFTAFSKPDFLFRIFMLIYNNTYNYFVEMVFRSKLFCTWKTYRHFMDFVFFHTRTHIP